MRRINLNLRKRGHHNAPSGRRANRRSSGVAMLLVLVCLATATIATTAYVTSRDNSALIGENVAHAAAARWAASSGLEFALAVIEAGADWRGGHVNGAWFDSHPLAGAAVDIHLVDVETRRPPVETTSVVEIRVTARVGNVRQIAKGIATIPMIPDVAGVDLSEFGVFARDRIEIRDAALIARWGSTPFGRVGRRVALGTGATDANSVDISENSLPIDCLIYHRADADPSLVRSVSVYDSLAVPMFDPIPLPKPPHPGVEEPVSDGGGGLLGGLIGTVLGVLNTTTTILVDTVTGLLDLNGSSSVVTIRDSTLVVKEDIRLRSGAGIIVEGDVKIVVFGSVDMGSNTYIELRPDSRLRLFVRGAVEVNNAYIGTSRASNVRITSGGSPWRQDEAVFIYSIDEGATPTWRLRGDSEVRAGIYAPNARVRIIESAALYGRVAAREFLLRDVASLFYDPTMDKRVGYTNELSALFDDGRIRNAAASLASLDADQLESLSSALGVRILAGGEHHGTVDEDAERAVEVRCEVVAFGSDVNDWERNAE